MNKNCYPLNLLMVVFMNLLSNETIRKCIRKYTELSFI